MSSVVLMFVQQPDFLTERNVGETRGVKSTKMIIIYSSLSESVERSAYQDHIIFISPHSKAHLWAESGTRASIFGDTILKNLAGHK